MSFIRTKENKIIEITEKGCIKEFKGKLYGFKEKEYSYRYENGQEIISQSENLEELCDEFVIVRNGERPTILINYDNLSLLKARIKKDNQKVYGAIWCERGLIYVAKINESGELKMI